MRSVSDIKLIRTDTTLDLSHEAEKRYKAEPPGLLSHSIAVFPLWSVHQNIDLLQISAS